MINNKYLMCIGFILVEIYVFDVFLIVVVFICCLLKGICIWLVVWCFRFFSELEKNNIYVYCLMFGFFIFFVRVKIFVFVEY